MNISLSKCRKHGKSECNKAMIWTISYGQIDGIYVYSMILIEFSKKMISYDPYHMDGPYDMYHIIWDTFRQMVSTGSSHEKNTLNQRH